MGEVHEKRSLYTGAKIKDIFSTEINLSAALRKKGTSLPIPLRLSSTEEEKRLFLTFLLLQNAKPERNIDLSRRPAVPVLV